MRSSQAPKASTPIRAGAGFPSIVEVYHGAVVSNYTAARKCLPVRRLRSLYLTCYDRVMNAFQAWQFLLVALAGWMNRHQQDVIDYIREENRFLRSKLKGKRIRFTDEGRRRLAVKGKALGRSVLNRVASIITPDTILRWHRNRIAAKYDSSGRREPGRPCVQWPAPNLCTRCYESR